MKYYPVVVLESRSSWEIASNIVEMGKKGWEPIGGVSTAVAIRGTNGRGEPIWHTTYTQLVGKRVPWWKRLFG